MTPEPDMEDLFPVVLAVPTDQQLPRGRQRVEHLSTLARRALRHSAQLSGATLGALQKDDDGRPLPSRGIYWSLSHKPRYVAAVAALFPVGIDIERIKPVKSGLHAKVATDAEWRMVGYSDKAFFQIWTAKEAVVKAEGVGFAGFGRCRVMDPPVNDRMHMRCGDRRYRIEFSERDGHLAAVTVGQGGCCWTYR